MASDYSNFDRPDRELEDYEYPDEPDDEEEETPTTSCPHCGAEVYEEALQCPICGDYITPTPSTFWAGRPVWWIVLGALGIVTTVIALAVL